ncbi:S9 family peptidase [Shewanella sp. WXL01]|uniref:alpha/beta hydrolase family protein n=1 Tax=Shewanella sp. WXL01 TaxID=2709721 RepID=UPI0014385345|nr:S9 family peptidase [Shewanella sp. WXL01]NKF52771.1 S9 family peptidase [Shewanella sp. WXL01]
MKNILLLAASTMLACTSFSALSVSLSKAELFTKGAEYSNVKISPDGDYLSALTTHDGKKTLIFLKTDTKKLINAVRFPGNSEVGGYEWVNGERVVLQKMYKKGWSEQPLYYGELMAVNADGSQPKYLFGYQGGGQTGSHIKKNTAIRATAYILDPLPDDDRHMLVHAIPWAATSEPLHKVFRVDIYRGKRKKVVTAPIPHSQFLTNNSGEVKFVAGVDKNNENKLFYRENSEWVNSDELNLGLNDFYPIAFADDANTIYAAGSTNSEPNSIYEINLKTGKKNKIVHDEKVDPSKFWINQQTKQLYAVEFEDGYPSYAFVDKADKHSTLLKQLLASLPGNQIHIVSETRDSKIFVVKAFNDRNPGDYYLFNSEKMSLEYLASERKWLDPELMAEMKPINFTNRDGINISGFLTLPHGKEAKNLPLIVNPHGGPHGVRDWWGFDEQNQLLAQAGFAVLQVNFRGSGGYGSAFEDAGKRRWGTDTQHDIIDATKYVINEGIANKDKVCIVGGSFGGYSALQSSIIEPDMYKCAVGFAGVYDLELMFEEGDVADRRSGMSYLKEVLGEDKAVLHAMSPTKHVNKLKAKLMLVHGEDDERAPIEQLEALEESLKAADYPYKKLVMDNEGHGFYNDKHRAKYYHEMISFIKDSLAL